jgi:hypothetical protein
VEIWVQSRQTPVGKFSSLVSQYFPEWPVQLQAKSGSLAKAHPEHEPSSTVTPLTSADSAPHFPVQVKG